MMRRALAMAAFFGMALAAGQGSAADADKEKGKAALQKLNEFIGSWKGSGESKDAAKAGIWKETMNWGWKFSKDGGAKIAVEFGESKTFTKGEIAYDVEKKLFVLTATTVDGKEQVFEGDVVKKILTLKNTDAESKDVRTLALSTNNDGARLVYDLSVQAKGKGIAKKLFAVQHTKEGASIGASKKNECVVTGGLGTMAVTHKGKTYYVCCSGCRDAFNEEPDKIIAEFEKKNKK